ncbi:MAG TPA: hypothetical protein VEV17_25310 [Bryobacteraceae bacterium]|nr:hypothetical protein [Bryobacteraceae bacterium]
MRNLCAAAAFLVASWLAAPALAQDKPNFTGTWQFDASKSELHNVKMASATWLIEEKDNSIHITETEGGRKLELKCSTDGKDCDASDKAKASFWYNGPLLVEMETRGDHVVRYRLKLADDGKSMRVELTHIVPALDGIDVLMFAKS